MPGELDLLNFADALDILKTSKSFTGEVEARARLTEAVVQAVDALASIPAGERRFVHCGPSSFTVRSRFGPQWYARARACDPAGWARCKALQQLGYAKGAKRSRKFRLADWGTGPVVLDRTRCAVAIAPEHKAKFHSSMDEATAVFELGSLLWDALTHRQSLRVETHGPAHIRVSQCTPPFGDSEPDGLWAAAPYAPPSDPHPGVRDLLVRALDVDQNARRAFGVLGLVSHPWMRHAALYAGFASHQDFVDATAARLAGDSPPVAWCPALPFWLGVADPTGALPAPARPADAGPAAAVAGPAPTPRPDAPAAVPRRPAESVAPFLTAFALSNGKRRSFRVRLRPHFGVPPPPPAAKAAAASSSRQSHPDDGTATQAVAPPPPLGLAPAMPALASVPPSLAPGQPRAGARPRTKDDGPPGRAGATPGAARPAEHRGRIAVPDVTGVCRLPATAPASPSTEASEWAPGGFAAVALPSTLAPDPRTRYHDSSAGTALLGDGLGPCPDDVAMVQPPTLPSVATSAPAPPSLVPGPRARGFAMPPWSDAPWPPPRPPPPPVSAGPLPADPDAPRPGSALSGTASLDDVASAASALSGMAGHAPRHRSASLDAIAGSVGRAFCAGSDHGRAGSVTAALDFSGLATDANVTWGGSSLGRADSISSNGSMEPVPPSPAPPGPAGAATHARLPALSPGALGGPAFFGAGGVGGVVGLATAEAVLPGAAMARWPPHGAQRTLPGAGTRWPAVTTADPPDGADAGAQRRLATRAPPLKRWRSADQNEPDPRRPRTHAVAAPAAGVTPAPPGAR